MFPLIVVLFFLYSPSTCFFFFINLDKKGNGGIKKNKNDLMGQLSEQLYQIGKEKMIIGL
jgi:hypothetical protein